MDTPSLDRLQNLLRALGTEIVMAQPGSTQGQFPILDLLGNIRDEAARFPELAAVHAEAAGAWEKVLGAVESGQPFDAAQVEWLGQLFQRLEALAEATESASAPAEAFSAGQTSLADGSGDFPVAQTTAGLESPADRQAGKPALQTPGADDELVLTLNVESDGELLREFVTESREHLDHIEQGVIVLEKQPQDATTLNTIFRAFHTFKGGAGFLNLVPINRLAHVLESLLDLARQHKLAISPPVIDLILRGRDTLQTFLNEIDAQLAGEKPNVPCLIPTEELKGQVEAILKNPAAKVLCLEPAAPSDSIGFRKASDEPNPTIPFLPESDGKSASPSAPAKSDSVGFRKASDEPKPTIPFLPESDGKSAGPSAPSKASDAGASSNRAAASVKVDTQKLDGLVDLIGELVIAQSQVTQDLSHLMEASPLLARHVAQMGRISKELQRVSLSMRMVPICGAFQKMARVVRDLAAKQGKQVQLVTSGEDTELDRNVVEALADPLLHMIRNSVDHGVETPERRAASGKPALATIHLRAYHQGGNIHVEVEDDGRGLNCERILAKAVERGLAAPGAVLPDEVVCNLIFAAGFSTAEEVTDVSGRGVGLDVVRRNIEKLRGRVDVSSKPGQGTLFRLLLPLTLAIIDGLIVKVGDERYIIPTLAVCEAFRPTPQMLTVVQGRGEVLNVRGRLLPLVRLHQFLGVAPVSSEVTEGLVIVVQAGATTRALLVDSLVSKQEVVIKSLGDLLQQRSPALAGAAILGDGRVGLILDVNALAPSPATALRQAA